MWSENDIVTRLRQFGDSYGLDAEAADEIERLQDKSDWLETHVGALVIVFHENKKEIERLREVVDKLAMHLDAFFGMLEPASNEIAEVLKEWKEAHHEL